MGIGKYCGELVDMKYIGYPQPEDSKSNQIKSLSTEEIAFLASKGYPKGGYQMIWKSIGLTSYIFKKKGRRGELVLVDKQNNIYEVKGGKNLIIHDLFTVGDRIFLVAMSFHSGNGKRYIEEIIWDRASNVFKIDEPRFYMGANYKGITDKKNHYILDGYNWNYKINKKTGVIESGNVCGDDVIINYAL